MSINFALLFYRLSPSHSYIVDLSDGTWEDHMEQEDFEEISSCYDNALNKPLPDYLKEILCKLDKKVSL